MLLITGPLFAGKRECAAKLLGVPMERLADLAVWDVQDLAAAAPDLTALADALGRAPGRHRDGGRRGRRAGGPRPARGAGRPRAGSAACWRRGPRPLCASAAAFRSS